MKSSGVVECDDAYDVVGREPMWDGSMLGFSKLFSMEIRHDMSIGDA
jgi:hypothetical protein